MLTGAAGHQRVMKRKGNSWRTQTGQSIGESMQNWSSAGGEQNCIRVCVYIRGVVADVGFSFGGCQPKITNSLVKLTEWSADASEPQNMELHQMKMQK